MSKDNFTVEWRKLRRKWKRKGLSKAMRVVTIPRKFIEGAGFDPDEELEGKWEAKDRHLILRIREAEGSGLSSKLRRKLLGGEGK